MGRYVRGSEDRGVGFWLAGFFVGLRDDGCAGACCVGLPDVMLVLSALPLGSVITTSGTLAGCRVLSSLLWSLDARFLGWGAALCSVVAGSKVVFLWRDSLLSILDRLSSTDAF
jgi:hypothetical protein